MSFYGVQLDVQVMRIIMDMKLKFSKIAGGLETRKLSMWLKHFDVNNCGLVSAGQLKEALHKVAIIYRSNEYQVLMANFEGPNGSFDYLKF